MNRRGQKESSEDRVTNSPDYPKLHHERWLSSEGQMAAAIRAYDWNRTPLGAIDSWSPALRTTVRILLANRFPMLLWWGPHYIQLYNDAYRPILGSKHPDMSLGQPVSKCWSEIWDILQPLVDTPYHGGPSTWNDDLQVEINRHGFVEESHFTIAYSPVPDDTTASGIGGVLATVHEITEKVLGERRVTALRDLAARATASRTAEEACATAVETLSKHAKDIPYALLYLINPDQRTARLAAATGIQPDTSLSAREVDLVGETDPQLLPLAEAMRTETIQTVADMAERFGASVPQGPWSVPPRQAVIVPIRSNIAHHLSGFLVAGVSARLQLDELYLGFYELVAGQISTAIANAQAYEEERKRVEALAEIDRAKTTFFSNISHEFRTPLTLMLGPLEGMMAEFGKSTSSLGPADYQQIALIHRNGVRLLRLVNTLLDFSRIEAGRAQAIYEPTDLSLYTAELVSVFRSAVEKAGLKLIVRCHSVDEPAFIDREMWEKIVLNLVSNAFKFTFEGEIEVALRNTGTHFELAVRDTGTGIPADQVPRLFERFYRVAGARGRTHEGSGIGLALVQELARLHGGSVSVESVYGKGSIFRVFIPVGRSHLPHKQIGVQHPHTATEAGGRLFIEEALRWLPQDQTDDNQLVIEEAAPARVQEQENKRQRILLADDNADMREYIRRLLSARYDVTAVADGEAALEAIDQQIPDLVLSDIMMPRLDGLELLARLRANPQTSILPIILLSARAGEESRVEGLQSGADDYLIKPFSARELLARVTAHLETARIRRNAAEAIQASEAKVRSRNAQLSLLAESLQHLLSSNDPDQIVRELFLKVTAHLDIDTYFNYLLGPDNRLTLHSYAGVSNEIVKTIERLDLGQYLCGKVVQTSQPTIATDLLTSDEEKAVFVRGLGIQTYTCYPLISGERVLGTLAFASRTRTQFEVEELQFLRIISHYVAVTLERVQRERALRFEIAERTRAEQAMHEMNQELERRVEARTKELLESQHRLRRLAAELNLAEQRERQRLASDLHDYLGQLLALSRIKLGLIQKQPIDPSLGKVVTELQESMDKALAYTRTLISQLHPPDFDAFGLVVALQWLATQIYKEGLPVTVDVKTKVSRLREEQELVLFQTVRELLMNCTKHARAQQATISLEQRGGSLKVTVSDDGCGFDIVTDGTGTRAASSGFGLFSVRERMLSLQGEVDFKSIRGKGTTVTLLVPLPEGIHERTGEAGSTG